jgi:hypothetical protein
VGAFDEKKQKSKISCKCTFKEAVSRIKEKVTESDKDEFEKMKGARIDILGKSTSTKETEKGRIHTVPVLITCGCKMQREGWRGL